MRNPPRPHGRRGGEREGDLLGGVPVYRCKRERDAGGRRAVPPGGLTAVEDRRRGTHPRSRSVEGDRYSLRPSRLLSTREIGGREDTSSQRECILLIKEESAIRGSARGEAGHGATPKHAGVPGREGTPDLVGAAGSVLGAGPVGGHLTEGAGGPEDPDPRRLGVRLRLPGVRTGPDSPEGDRRLRRFAALHADRGGQD